MGSVQLSYYHVRAISRLAAVDPDATPRDDESVYFTQSWTSDSRWRCAAGSNRRAARSCHPDRRSREITAGAFSERGRPWARIAGGPGLSANVVHRLICGGRIRSVVHQRFGATDDTPLDLGRTRRLVTSGDARVQSAAAAASASCAPTAASWRRDPTPARWPTRRSPSKPNSRASATTQLDPVGPGNASTARTRSGCWPTAVRGACAPAEPAASHRRRGAPGPEPRRSPSARCG